MIPDPRQPDTDYPDWLADSNDPADLNAYDDLLALGAGPADDFPHDPVPAPRPPPPPPNRYAILARSPCPARRPWPRR